MIKVPTVAMRDGGESAKLPPADVPEHLLFAMMQRKRAQLVAHLAAFPPEAVNASLQQVLQTALRVPTFQVSSLCLLLAPCSTPLPES